MTTVQIINATLQLWGSLISILIGIGLNYAGRYRTDSGRIYLAMLVLNTSSMLFDVVALFLLSRPGRIVTILLWTTNTASFLCNILLIPTFFQYLLVYLQGHKVNVEYSSFRVVFILSALMVLALLVNLFCPFIYYIGPDNIYYRGKFHAFACIGGLIGLMTAVFLIVKYRSALHGWERIALISYILIPIVAVPLQEMFKGLAFITIGNTLSLTLIYMCFQVHQAHQLAEQENALIQSRYTTAFSQIQPHFMFNALNSIQYLCKTDPQKASRAISSFAKYLRVNMDSLNCNHPVPLSEDLTHLENYLSLQRIRFPDIVFEFHLETKDFELPLLTLQPLVENAIRHVVRQLSTGGIIAISSWEDTCSYHLQVEDNGGGFPEAQTDDEDTQLELNNTRMRIELMSHGQMQVENHPGQGVTVHIRIPKEKHGFFISR